MTASATHTGRGIRQAFSLAASAGLLVMAAVSASAPCRAQEAAPAAPPAPPPPPEQLTGDWGGLRNEWAASGYCINPMLTQFFVFPVAGDLKSDNQDYGKAEVPIDVDGAEVGRGTVARTVPAAFTASECFNVGVDLGSPVSLDYYDRAPFKFSGTIEEVIVELK